ncbi:MAG: two-component system response regulator [Deltaproteobacteria bacterium RIFCSPLOWO2_12_FULL_43_16]|nr:MAG: two-component system response regulator [Deltaproteobacteria bacterium GWA2_43_19]OGQ12446.1 MAG: two-component system response regulator [Deltaproteobacteria bacterium RIFCSPHIGHO2_02_FULL_43_33]OGQ35904.1 MAG: two-component system response regulator [Deltaproteobacteria bacterium RIFCSPLOWO2_01_FULL_42_9]OGQ59419.1 MAG: two-component system response regulator [Deltaproteobacteria bacterium RIFCSPLOWO2_12_FULL_43_16]HBR17840.1 response regulator [Deltaproteobacteria bacterium]
MTLPAKILIVEDSPTTRAMITSAVEVIDGLEIFESKSGFEALKLLPHHSFDLILTDINMPDINGLELVNFVKKNPDYKHIPLIIITTEGSEKDKEKGLSLGADEYLVKPFDPETLQRLVKKYLKVGVRQ